MTFDAKRRANELELLGSRLEEIQDEAPMDLKRFFAMLKYSARALARRLRRYDRTGPDCEIDEGV